MTAGGHLLVPDLGIFTSKDPVAIDQACVDQVTKARGLPMSPAETGTDSPHGRIEPYANAMEPDGQKLGLYSRFVDPESRPIIAETQLTAAVSQGIGNQEYELILIKSKNQEKKK